VALAALAMTAAAGTEVTRVPKRGEIALRLIADDNDIATPTTIAAIGTTPRHMRLTPKADDAIATPPTLDINLGPVIEHDRHDRSPNVR
jgi:hypothetical protein